MTHAPMCWHLRFVYNDNSLIMMTNICSPAHQSGAARQGAGREGQRGEQAQHPGRRGGRLPQQRHPPPVCRHPRHEPPPGLIRLHQQKTVQT